MNLKNKLLAAALSLSIVSPSHAIFGVGDIVADPGSYVYYAEQITQMAQQVSTMADVLETAKDTYDTAQDTYDGVRSMADDVTGVYDNALGLIESTGVFKEVTDQLPSGLQNKYYKLNKYNDDPAKAFKEMADYLASNYKDPLSADYDPVKYDMFRFITEQQAAETVLKTSAQRLDGLKPRVETIDELANKIDSTENIKDSADLQNRFLAEILIVITEMNDTLQQMAQLEAFNKYRGAEVAEAVVENNKNGVEEPQDDPLDWMRSDIDKAHKNDPKLKNKPF